MKKKQTKPIEYKMKHKVGDSHVVFGIWCETRLVASNGTAYLCPMDDYGDGMLLGVAFAKIDSRGNVTRI